MAIARELSLFKPANPNPITIGTAETDPIEIKLLFKQYDEVETKFKSAMKKHKQDCETFLANEQSKQFISDTKKLSSIISNDFDYADADETTKKFINYYLDEQVVNFGDFIANKSQEIIDSITSYETIMFGHEDTFAQALLPDDFFKSSKKMTAKQSIAFMEEFIFISKSFPNKLDEISLGMRAKHLQVFIDQVAEIRKRVVVKPEVTVEPTQLKM